MKSGRALGRIDEDYIVSAWRAAFRLMDLDPWRRKHFALSAAELLAQLSAVPGTYPEHDKQAVIITEATHPDSCEGRGALG